MKLIILGPPGAGKGTQAENIVKRYGIAHISTGDIFRKNLKENTELGLKAKEYMDNGLLVPDDLTVAMVKERLRERDCENGYLLDGFPRTIAQAQALELTGEKIDAALCITVDYAVLTDRIIGRRMCRICGAPYHAINLPPKKEGVCDRCGGELYQRDDDKAETVIKRLKEYDEKTQPLIDYYKDRKILRMVDGQKSIEAVSAEIVAILDELE